MTCSLIDAVGSTISIRVGHGPRLNPTLPRGAAFGCYIPDMQALFMKERGGLSPTPLVVLHK